MIKMEGLKPCPFCGGKAQERWTAGKYTYMAFIRCTICGVQTKVAIIPESTFNQYFYDENHKMKDNPDDEFWETEPFQIASMRWNKRTTKRRTKDA